MSFSAVTAPRSASAGDPRPALPLVLEVDGEPTHPDGWDGFGARRPIWPGTASRATSPDERQY